MTIQKRINFAYLVYLFVMGIQIFDVFVLRSQESDFSINIISRVVGIIISLVVSAVMGLNLKKFCFRSYSFLPDVLFGLIYSTVPVALVYLFKYIYFNYRNYDNLVLTFRPTGYSSDEFNENSITILAFYILSLLVFVVFKEIFYRGYLMTQFAPKYGVNASILIQTLFYTVSYVPVLVYYLITGKFDSQSRIMTVFLVLGQLFYHLLCGIKWGVFYKVNGSVWMSVVDHFVNKFLITSFFFTETRLPEKWYIIEIVVIQILSFLLFLPQYFRRDKMNELAAEEYALSREALKMGVDDYFPSVIRKSIDTLVNGTDRFNDGHSLVDGRELEEAVPFDSSQLVNEENLMLSVRGYEINDSQFDYKNDVTDHDSSPAEKSKEYFDNLVGRTSEDHAENFNADSEATLAGAENISKLVEEYFKKNFDKHTFTKDKK